MNTSCLECSEKITGRADKKFCCDQCRTQFHNRATASEARVMREVNAVLRKNRRILSDILGDSEVTRIPREKLLTRGFDFTFSTRHLEPVNGRTWQIIYDVGCAIENREEVLISRFNSEIPAFSKENIQKHRIHQ
jgi:hypothetical protein